MKLRLLYCALAITFSHAVIADEEVTLKETFAVESNSTINIDVPVGQLEINTHSGNDVVLEVLIKETNDSWFSSIDLDDAKIEHRTEQTHAYFSVDVEDTSQHWTVTIPENIHLDLDMGVGKVNIDGAKQNITLDLGVGDAELKLNGNNYNRISLDTGVGDADLYGFGDYESERNIVSKNVKWQGNGEYKISVDVGVGDIEVRH